MAGTESGLIAGAYGLNDIPSALLKYDKDKDYAGMIIYIQREIANFTFLVREMLPKQQVFSHEPVLAEVTERSWKFNLQATGPAGSSGVMLQSVTFTDAVAANLQAGDFLMVDGIYYNGTGTWTTIFAAASGPKEVARVVTVGSPGSAGSTNTTVQIERGWGGDATGTPTQLTTSMNLVLMNSAASEGSRSRRAVGKNIATASNYVQLFREPYEATDFEMDEDLFFNERPEQINANLASALLMKKIEFTFWSGWPNKRTDGATGKMLYTSGGVIPFIPKDSTHQISFSGPVTPTGLNAMFKDIALQGGDEERYFFCGYSLATAIANAFDNKLVINDNFKEQYSIIIPVLKTSIGLKVNIVPSFALTEMGYDWEGFVLDLGSAQSPYFQYMYMEDLYINAGRDGKGIQANDEFTRKEEFVGKIGLIRRAANYQFHIYGVSQVL